MTDTARTAQALPARTEPALPEHTLRPEEIPAIVAEIGRLVREFYVFPEIAEQLVGIIEDRAAQGRYEATADAGALAALLSEDLQSVNGDRHLRVLFHPYPVPAEPGGAMMTRLTREADLSLGGVPLVRRMTGGVALLELAPILFPTDMTGESLVAALNLVARAEALILDLRECVGGAPHTVALICSYLLDRPTHLNTIYDRADDDFTQSWSVPMVHGPKFGGSKPLYLLTSRRTFSAAEELTYDLQQLGRATVVGERTGGGANPRKGFTLHPHLEASIPTARAINPVSGTNWELVGITPDIETDPAEALATAHRAALVAVAGSAADSLSAEEARRILAGERPPGGDGTVL